ncbi:predicted protein [Nematostella vectensis]|uniref:G-protein coupled receptors family 1 profile domain-containing protein n=1 Tax=Nematostella vectensis TaxID=45351 RepID=A7T260_NEMVE|nr:predicted protein [Nematostella vectensis]|eukprot:XP_001622053.1 hypothetical protein NEMVEDRAFT_v1g221220 [Nematostella vectensis]
MDHDQTFSNNSSSPPTFECSWTQTGTELWSYVTLCILSSVLSLISNSVFLFTVYKTPSIQTVPNFFVCSLSTADLTAGVVANPVYASIAITGISPSGDWLSLVEKFIWIQTLVVTSFSLALVSVDRCIAIVSPLKYYNIVSERRCFLSISLVWVMSILLAVPGPFLSGTDLGIFWLNCGAFSVLLPLLVISYCYVQIFRVVRLQSKQLHSKPLPRRSMSSYHKKASATTAIIIALFIILFTPNFVFAFLFGLAKDECEVSGLLGPWLWALLVAYSGSFLNPWIYGLRNSEIRRAMRKVFGGSAVCRVNSQWDKELHSEMGSLKAYRTRDNGMGKSIDQRDRDVSLKTVA